LVAVMGTHVIIPEYPGYGMAHGQSNEVSVMSNVKGTQKKLKSTLSRHLAWSITDAVTPTNQP
jgi:hypothetical protein